MNHSTFHISVLTLAVFSLCGGCISTVPKGSTMSMLNPDFEGKKYSRLLVVVDGEVKDDRKRLEFCLIKELWLGMPGLFLVAGSETITTPLTNKKVSGVAKKKNLDATLIVSILKTKRVNGHDTALTVSLQANLIDSTSGGRVWTNQSALTARNALEILNLYPSMAKAVASQLIAANILHASSRYHRLSLP